MIWIRLTAGFDKNGNTREVFVALDAEDGLRRIARETMFPATTIHTTPIVVRRVLRALDTDLPLATIEL